MLKDKVIKQLVLYFMILFLYDTYNYFLLHCLLIVAIVCIVIHPGISDHGISDSLGWSAVHAGIRAVV